MPDEQWLAEVLTRPGYHLVGEARAPVTHSPARAPMTQDVSEVIVCKPPALGALSGPYRSKTEARYADQLAWRVACGEVKRWLYEPVSLRLGADCFYRPDFLVEYVEMMPLQFVEVKGAWIRDRAMDKPKTAATRFPMFMFVLAVWQRQAWTHRRIAAHA